MDEEIQIINTATRGEKIKNFFIENKKKIIISASIIIIILFSLFFYQELKESQKEELAQQFNQAAIIYENGNETEILESMKKIIYSNDSTYSPLAFYFLLDNNLITDKNEINGYFDIIITKTDLNEEMKDLNIFKKALFNSEFVEENELLNILNPLIKSNSVWKSHSLYLMGEYYLSKNQKQKSKEFFEQIVALENINTKIQTKAQRILRAEFSE
tara:strand:+ start:274 stop:918 length:645 start_codon:yes stop_codon:yes gene_type:complete